jgi:hypothetical protein
MELEFSESDTSEERLRKELLFERELTKKLYKGLEVLTEELSVIAHADKNTPASALKTYAFECLLRYGKYK